MKITILNGNSDINNASFDNYLAQLSRLLEAGGHEVTHFSLRDMNINYCVGCFGCWVKTPGECIQKDDGELVLRAVINSDFLLWAAPMKMGFPDALLKKIMDRSIPLVHPYFEVVNDEAHHRARYVHYPLPGLLLEKEADTTDAEAHIAIDTFSRTALNLKSRLTLAAFTDQPVEQVARAIEIASANHTPFDDYPVPTSGVQITPPRRITAFNGSPRMAKANTAVLFEQFLKGFASVPGNSSEIIYIGRRAGAEELRQAVAGAECVWLGFPLYTDSMPGIVKAFIESLEPLRGRPDNPPIGFLVQSGFPESAHSRHVERYLQALAARLGSPYLGTIVKGGSEGVRLMPDNMNRKLFDRLNEIGRGFAESGRLNPALLADLAKPERYGKGLIPLFKMLSLTPLLSFYWDGELKKNGAYNRRFARPYA
jgi:multimeric flavodoxin WrbA